MRRPPARLTRFTRRSPWDDDARAPCGTRGDDHAGAAAMNAAFFGLAFLAALNPKLFAVDLLLMGNERPRLMFLSFLLGGLAICTGIGLLDVFVFRADA